MIYLVESQIGPIKIGYSRKPEYRLSCIQSWSPCLLRLIAKWTAPQSEEFALHQRFSVFRQHGEWFLPQGELSEFVESKRGVGLSDVLDWSKIEIHFGDPRPQQSERAKQRWADPVWRAETEARRQARFEARREGLTT